MSWKVWKGKNERAKEEFENAISLRNQGKYPEALRSFHTASELFLQSGDQDDAKISTTMASLYKAIADPTYDNLMECSHNASSLHNDLVLKVPQEISAEQLANETNLLARFIQFKAHFEDGGQDRGEMAQKFEELAQIMFQAPFEEFRLADIARGIASESPQLMGFRLMGMAKLARGNNLYSTDPSKAQELFAEAVEYFRNAKQPSLVSETENRRDKAGAVATCWFCGRTVQGEDYHFAYLNASLTPYLRTNSKDDSSQTTSNDNSIVACLPCNSAIRGIADSVSRAYYEQVIEQLNQVRRELMERMSNLENRSAFVGRRY